MVRLQNLTNSTIKFQGIIIGAHCFADFSSIYDYVTLSRLCGSSKASYCYVTPKSIKTQVTTEQKDNNEDKIETNTVPILNKEVTEKIVDTVDKKELDVEDIVETVDVEETNDSSVDSQKTTTKRPKRGKNTK